MSSCKKIVLLTLLVCGLSPYGKCYEIDKKLKDVFQQSKKERVAIIGIGDSNQYFKKMGWNKYMREAVMKTFGCYGTGLVETQNLFLKWSKPKGFINKNAPDEFNQLFSYYYLPDGKEDISDWSRGGLAIPADSPVNIKSELTCHIVYGTFKIGNGSFQPVVRKNQPPWNILKCKSTKILTNTGTNGISGTNLILPPDHKRDYPLMFLFAPVNTAIPGPFLVAYTWVENNMKIGCSYQTLYGVGGHSLYEMLNNLRAKGEIKVANYFKNVRKSLNGSKTCIVMINSGLNDRNRNGLSIGPTGKFPSNSKDGYKDNLNGIVVFLQKCWNQAGGNENTIYFVFFPSHSISDPDDIKLTEYRDAAAELAQKIPNASCIIISKLVSHKYMEDNEFFDKKGNAHLTANGYKWISEAIISAINKEKQ
ncbi:MAG: SGNH/GDSL hydrolase family protein [Victivallales bacterium]|nr:SGNH/GDSL hydrolase family protein [Victivallales bacterium]